MPPPFELSVTVELFGVVPSSSCSEPVNIVSPYLVRLPLPLSFLFGCCVRLWTQKKKRKRVHVAYSGEKPGQPREGGGGGSPQKNRTICSQPHQGKRPRGRSVTVGHPVARERLLYRGRKDTTREVKGGLRIRGAPASNFRTNHAGGGQREEEKGGKIASKRMRQSGRD